MKKPKLDYVTREAMKIVGPYEGTMAYAAQVARTKQGIRHVLQRAEKVCDDIAFAQMDGLEEVAIRCRDAIKALRLSPRPRGVFRAESSHGRPNKPDRS